MNTIQRTRRCSTYKALPFPQASVAIDPSTRRFDRAEWLAIERNLRRGGALNRFQLRLVLLLVLRSLVFRLTRGQEPHQDADDQDEPKDIDGLEHCEKTKCDDLGDPAFVLLRIPVQVVWSDSGELAVGEQRCKDYKIEVVSKVCPDDDEEAEIPWRDPRIDVVEAFGGLS